MKIKVPLAMLILTTVASALFCGCVQYPREYGTFWRAGISPLYPEMNYGYFDRYQTINTLAPELKWKDLKKPGETYELCVWETPYRSVKDIKQKSGQALGSWGTVVYEATNIVQNVHQVATPLKPGTYYNWSVRIRHDDKVGDWSAFSQQRSVLNAIFTYSNIPFGFKTPAP
jgi:hypothetical protein